MTTAKMHRERVFETIAPLTGTQELPLHALLDAPRRLAADVSSPIDVPGFDNSSMDGYALAAAPWRRCGNARFSYAVASQRGPVVRQSSRAPRWRS
ncbi:hypothetical protein [Brevibacterium sp. JSBI002]|uniref:hypothetical protein n=1 Tax=Brevibacterium sp. JSBI002 TaxID=2886045 RepID=UPI00222EAB99|nr:hypothetical protein [Brevibacterium sp. JSBI002]UZD63730.1 hypothetical protein LJ362_07890 [Brevibacterium sp. JSBI002]